jgi:antitoxin FitA
MSRVIQIRNVPDKLHREAKARAAQTGLTLSDFALRALEREVHRPAAGEVAARVRALEALPGVPSGAALVREARDGR